MKKNIIFLLLASWLLSLNGLAQQAEQLKVASMNIDGLPKKILVFNVNADGPGEAGTSRIGKYITKNGFDIACFQEDFNYHEVMVPWLEDDYHIDQWSGAVGIDVPDYKVDLLHAQNVKFPCDGLGACWKRNIVETATERVTWKKTFGKFSHALDELVTKGFRRSELTLASGARIIVYNTHMDASDRRDAMEGRDSLDRDARLSEWRQLCDDVLAHLDTRPVIIVGDMNSYYARDKVKAEFIDKIAESGKGTAYDVWVELEKGGKYPEPKEGAVFSDDPSKLIDGEGLDKIIYINPTEGTQLRALSFDVDIEGYQHEGQPLGDHYPAIATFAVENAKTAVMSLPEEMVVETPAEYYDLKGVRVDAPSKGIYIEHQGKHNRKRVR